MRSSVGADDLFEAEMLAATPTLTSDLYHYTTADSAILGILANKTLRMSSFLRTNDLWESRPILPPLQGSDRLIQLSHAGFAQIAAEIDRHIRQHSKVACFTQDWSLPEQVRDRNARRGWAHLSMWAHYGAGHTGVCLRFDRDRLLHAFNAASAGSINQYADYVRYRHAELGVGGCAIDFDQLEEYGADAVALQYARANWERIYFRKHSDWSSESEFRLVRTDVSLDAFDLDISSALTGVILGESFPRERIPGLLTALEGFPDVVILKTIFYSRVFLLDEWEPSLEESKGPLLPPEATPLIPARRDGDLLERMRELEEIQGAAR
jgi:hypothetical protein